MDTRLNEIFDNTISHSSFLNKEEVKSCMEQSYKLGTYDVLNWLSKMDYLSDNVPYIIEEWERKNSK
jgi:hypothetical protein